MAALLIAVSVPAAAQTTIFNTKDFRQDRALWGNPTYYKNNTAGQLRGMAIGIVPYENTGQVGSSRVYGTDGTGKPGALNITSTYPFKTAQEHYDAWLKDAKGGTKHTKMTLPDWAGRWNGGGEFGSGAGPASEVVKLLTPKYQEYYVQELKASTEGRIWSPNSFCLPNGFFPTLSANEFVVTPEKVVTLTEGNGWNGIRWIYTDGVGHTPKDLQFPKWAGESAGFWNGDTLIVHTNQMKAWKGGFIEYTDDLETVEKYRRNGDRIEGEITIYDPAVLVKPVTVKLNYRLDKDPDPTKRPLYNSCADTNGPSPKVFMDAKGLLNEHIPGEAGFQWSETDPRPWGTWLTESDKRFKAYLASGGKPPGAK
jgi:hypothetical protein